MKVLSNHNGLNKCYICGFKGVYKMFEMDFIKLYMDSDKPVRGMYSLCKECYDSVLDEIESVEQYNIRMNKVKLIGKVMVIIMIVIIIVFVVYGIIMKEIG